MRVARFSWATVVMLSLLALLASVRRANASGIEGGTAGLAVQPAISLVGSNSTTSRTMTVPSGVQNGDLLLAFYSYWSFSTATPPSGWTLLQSSTSSGSGVETVWYRFASNNAPGSTFNWTFAGNVPYQAGGMLAYRGVASTAFEDGFCTSAGRGTTPSLCSFTTTSNNDLYLGFFATENTNLVLPSDLTGVVLKQYLNGSYFGVAAAGKSLSTPATIPADTGSMNSGGWASVAFALKPATAAATPTATLSPTATATPTMTPTPAPGAISLVGATSTTSRAAVVPTGVQNGDLLLAFYSYWSFATATAPSGWQLLQSATSSGSGVETVWYRFANNDVGGSSYNWTFGGSGPYAAGGMLAYRGVSTVSFEDGFCTNQGRSTTPGLCSFSTAAGSDLYLGFYATENTNLVLPADLSAVVLRQYLNGSYFGVAAATKTLASAGVVAADVGSMNSGGWATIALALRAIGSGPFPTATPTVVASTDVLTYHNDNGRTGQNQAEQILTTSNVNSTLFGKLFEAAVDGKVDAQPLIKTQLTIPGKGVHNVLYVVTEHDSVYAFDADSGSLLWPSKVSLLLTGESPSDTRSCGQVAPEIGITSTPVIDPNAGPNGTIYIVAMSKDGSGNYFQRIHALDLTTGAEEFGGPVTVTATVPGTGAGSINGQLPFVPANYKERVGLLLLPDGTIYTGWASHCDIPKYTGWIMSYAVNNNALVQTGVLNIIPNGSDGAIWQSGAGLAADSLNNIYFLDGNGTFDTTLTANGFPINGDFGNGFIKLSTSNGLQVADFFEMSNTVSESGADRDLGSGGALVLPDMTDSQGHTRHLAVGAGKDTNIYLVDRDNMSKFNPAGNTAVYQQLAGALPGGEWAMPAYFNNTLYYGGVNGPLQAYKFSSARLATNPASSSPGSYAYPGTTPSVSSNLLTNGIVWAIENAGNGVLHAYDATNLASELYNSNQAPNGRDSFQDNKFVTPTIANGKVYVGTPASVAVFGLLP